MSDKVWFVEQGEFDQLKFVAYQPHPHDIAGERNDKLKFVGQGQLNHSILLTFPVRFVSYSGRFSRPILIYFSLSGFLQPESLSYYQ
jgi:hypothetical protein